jgi:putative glycosyltransferase (TIGR04372 family)
MQRELDRLLTFCEKYSYVVCYGAGTYGRFVQQFLQDNNITVKCFLISGTTGEIRKHGIPVYSICDKVLDLNECGIILSLHEKYQPDVRSCLRKYCIKDDTIYNISAEEIKEMMPTELDERRNKTLFEVIDKEKKYISKYKKKFLKIQNDYEWVEISYIDAHNIGCFTLWVYFCYQREKKKDKVYYLYYPVTDNKDRCELTGPNGYLLSKLSIEGMEVISKQNVDFWRCFLHEARKKVVLRNKFQLWGWTADFQEFVNGVNCNKPYINFTKIEIQQGKNELKKMDITGEYVCISARDRAYYVETLQRVDIEEAMEEYRNSNIQSRCKAIDYLKRRKIQSVRMGATVELNYSKSGIIDYANKYRTEFMDVYLAANCEFFVSDLGGIQTLAMLFSKPMVVLNVPLLTVRCDNIPIYNSEKDISILKKFWDTKNKRYLTIREMLAIEVDGFRHEENITMNTFQLYRELGIVPIENTEDEILAVVKEMYERLNGERVYTEKECQLQERYRTIVDSYPKKDNILSQWRIGTEFLKQNLWLLD